jgi:hypothetical protein
MLDGIVQVPYSIFANKQVSMPRKSQRSMDELSVAKKRLKVAHDEQERDYKNCIASQDIWEDKLQERMSRLINKKDEIAKENGNIEVTNEDLVEVNAGGEIVVAKRSTLTQIRGSEFEAIFSGRWDKKILRDNHGRIFLDVNPTCFRAIVDYLNETLISSEDSPPSPPSVDEEFKHILRHQLDLFGIVPKVEMHDSTIIKDGRHCIMLHDWLKEDDSDGDFTLLYRGSRDDRLSSQAFHSKCDNKGCTLTLIETTCGTVIGGYTNTSWSSSGGWSRANKAFLFALSGSSISSPFKMKLKNEQKQCAIYNYSSYGPTFGAGHDLKVEGSNVHVFNPGSSYHTEQLPSRSFTIKEMEVFQVSGSPPIVRINASSGIQAHASAPKFEPVTTFSARINEAINTKQACLLEAEAKMLHLEEMFSNEQTFIEKFASGDAKDVIALNVSGTMMVTMRSTLCTIQDSVLAQQFDDSKWTEQGCNGTPVNEWTPDEVSTWAKNVEGLPEEVGIMLYENEINGRELLALSRDDLKVMGLKRIGTVALLLREISSLERTSGHFMTLIEHSPYCFGKILDHLRLKQLHSMGFTVNEPALPVVCDLQKERFSKVAKYYFPGDAAKSILG